MHDDVDRNRRSKMAADQKQNIKLVKEIENYPYIYNYTLPEYARRDVTEKAWIEIGQKVKLSGPECKEKWKNLRSVFARRLKRRKAGKAEKKPYYLAKYMQFTIPFLKMNSRVAEELPPYRHEEMSDSEAETKNCNDTDEEDEALFPTMGFHSILLPEPSPNSQSILPSEPSPNPSEQHSQTHSLDTSESSLPKKSLKRKINDFSKAEDITYNKTKYKLVKLKANQLDRKSNKMFLLSLLADMNAMDDKQRRFFKQRMLEVVDEIFNMEKPEV